MASLLEFRYERDVQAAFTELARFVGQILQQPSLCPRCRRPLLNLQNALARLPFVSPGFTGHLRVVVPGKARDHWCELDFTDVEIVLSVGGCHHNHFFKDDPYSTDLFYLARTGCRNVHADGIRGWIRKACTLTALQGATVMVSVMENVRFR
ncbi:MAG: hypothetical protein P8020_15410 [Acidobacteriota bacterium]